MLASSSLSDSDSDAGSARTVRVLGTGGTIAGTAAAGMPDNAYQAGQVAVEELLKPLLGGLGGQIERVQALQVAQIDSCNMDHAVWQRLAAELQAGLNDPSVVGQVVTHGTDTLEETAVFLQGVLRGSKPVVLTAAMRPATSAQADGPENLRQALHLAADPAARGVWMAFGGQAWPAVQVRKVHPFALDAFCGGDGLAAATWVAHGTTLVPNPAPGAWAWRAAKEPGSGVAVEPIDQALALLGPHPVQMPADLSRWPRVEIVHSHAGADGRVLLALLADASVQGVVISATGNGSIHDALHQALLASVSQGRLARTRVLVSSRCTAGWVVGDSKHGWPVAHRLSPAQARVALMLQLASTAP